MSQVSQRPPTVIAIRGRFLNVRADVDEIAIRYADPLELLRELRAAGETNAVALRDHRVPARALFPHALSTLPDPDGRVTAMLRLANMTGWAPSS